MRDVAKHILRTGKEAAAELLFTTRCVGCETPGTLLCPNCIAALPRIDGRHACPRCGAPFGAFNCTECTQIQIENKHEENFDFPFPFQTARAACTYEGVASSILTTYKDEGEVRLDRIIAALICSAVRGECVQNPHDKLPDWSLWADCLVSIPPDVRHVRARGFDHMQRIASLCARWLGLPLVNALQSAQVADQRGLSVDERFENRRNSINAAPQACISPHVLLIDDVFTTGATLSAAADALVKGGAHEVNVAVFARVW